MLRVVDANRLIKNECLSGSGEETSPLGCPDTMLPWANVLKAQPIDGAKTIHQTHARTHTNTHASVKTM